LAGRTAGKRRRAAGNSGYRDLDGCIPLFSIAAMARSDARNAISRLDASVSFELVTTAAAYTLIF
jgi:hypothetical protein